MVLTLDSRATLVWRSPTSLQFGVDPALVVLRDVTGAHEQVISALLKGVSKPGLTMLARSTGLREPELAALLNELAPVLATAASEPGVSRIDVVGTGPTAERIARTLAESGQSVVVAPTAAGVAAAANAVRAGRSDLAILVGHYVLDPELYGFWLRRDVPHLPVIFADRGVTIGPIVEPGRGPCLYCLERHRSDADPAWPAIASQLWGRKAPTETALVSREVTVTVVRLVLARIAGRVGMAAASAHLDAASGAITTRTEQSHPECGCVAIGPEP